MPASESWATRLAEGTRGAPLARACAGDRARARVLVRVRVSQVCGAAAAPHAAACGTVRVPCRVPDATHACVRSHCFHCALAAPWLMRRQFPAPRRCARSDVVLPEEEEERKAAMEKFEASGKKQHMMFVKLKEPAERGGKALASRYTDMSKVRIGSDRGVML